ncbi:SDR family NAD(P)-dependent oxidoreductase [Patescibacteria group bacterium]
MSVSNKIALVTGASTGIGRAIAVELSEQGFDLIITARREKNLQKTKLLIQSNCHIILADLSQLASVNQLIKEAKKFTSKLDLVVNVAGVWHDDNKVFAEIDYQKFVQSTILNTMTVGINAPMLLVHGLLPIMSKNSHIINISGTFEDGGKGWLPYYVSKKAIEDFTVGLSEELKEKGIYVNCISPSDTATKEYKKYFPEYTQDALSPKSIAQQLIKILKSKKTGKIVVVKKGKKPFESFHY